MKGVSTEAKVGLLVLLAAFILAFLTFQAGQYSLRKRNGFKLQVIFDSVAGLERKAKVRVNGVDAGFVEDISLFKGKPLLQLHLDDGIEIRENAIARIRSLGLMGEKYVEIDPGTEETPLIKNGGRIPTALDTMDIDKMTEQLGRLTDDLIDIVKSLKAVIGTHEGQARLAQIMVNIEKMTDGMNRMVIENQQEINRLVGNLADFSEELNLLMLQNKERVGSIVADLNGFSSSLALQGKKMVEDMSTVTGNLKGMVDPNSESGMGETFERFSQVAQRMDATIQELNQITARMNRGEGTIGKLLTDEKVYEQVSSVLGELNTTLKKSQDMTLHLGFRSEYLTEYEKTKSYFSLKFQPREGKYYILELVDDFKEHVTSRRRVFDGSKEVSNEEEYDNKLLVSLLMAKQFGPFYLRGGLMESGGGVGLDYYPFGPDICLGIEGWDFDLTRPHMKLFARMALERYFSLSIGWDDFANSGSQSFFVGAGFVFEDEDLKYLLTKIPIPGLP